jgi:hypothetical protein
VPLAIPFGGEGVITENSRDEQRKVIKYNHLVANCLIFHNVCSLTRIVQELQREGKAVPEEALAWHQPLPDDAHQPFRRLHPQHGSQPAAIGLRLHVTTGSCSSGVRSGPFSGESLPCLYQFRKCHRHVIPIPPPAAIERDHLS